MILESLRDSFRTTLELSYALISGHLDNRKTRTGQEMYDKKMLKNCKNYDENKIIDSYVYPVVYNGKNASDNFKKSIFLFLTILNLFPYSYALSVEVIKNSKVSKPN